MVLLLLNLKHFRQFSLQITSVQNVCVKTIFDTKLITRNTVYKNENTFHKNCKIPLHNTKEYV